MKLNLRLFKYPFVKHNNELVKLQADAHFFRQQDKTALYSQAIQKSIHVCVSDASCIESDNLFIKTALYILFRHDSTKFEQTDLDALLIWSVKEYLSSAGKLFEIWKISIAQLNANL